MNHRQSANRHQRWRDQNWRSRDGFTMIETVVSAGLLLVVISLVAQMTFRVDRVWTDTNNHRVAIQELSNQLDSLTQMPIDAARTKLESLELNMAVRQTLYEPEFSGELIEDEFGQRIVLRLRWSQGHPGKPVQLSGWMRQPQNNTKEEQE